eukprot:SM000195S05260  [mRNA]  locus=s195:14642:18773:- [translate_table: standard]
MAAAAALPDGALFLGLDSSTQSLKATALDSKLQIVGSESVNFDSALPHYNTKDGVHRDGDRITAPPQMWIEALDCVFRRLKDTAFAFDKVKAISGSGQQHGSVYWKRGAQATLRTLSDSNSLVSHLHDCFSTEKSPVWMDNSTSAQCRAIEAELGGPLALATLTGSRAFERFTGPQIRKLYETEPEVYRDTERISLVSSFMASTLVGDYAAIDQSDGAGMNLMGLKERVWLPRVLQATAPELQERLGPLAPSHAIAGKINPYFVKMYGFDPDCDVVQWSGDNPNSLAGTLEHPGDVAISLGTSDTVFGVTDDPKPGPEGNVFPNPVDPDNYMAMLVHKNASLTRQKIRDRNAKASWDAFSELLEATPPLNRGCIGFYYDDPEIFPKLPVGTHRYILPAEEGGQAKEVSADKFDDAMEVRALLEGQILSMRMHAERVGLPSPPERVIATGGGSANFALLKVIASVFGCPVYTASRPDSASTGAALRAAHGWLSNASGAFVPYSELLKLGTQDSAAKLELAVPGQVGELHSAYGRAGQARMELEKQLVQKLNPGAC